MIKMKVTYDNKDIWLTAETEQEEKFLKNIVTLRQVASWPLDEGGKSQTQFHINPKA